MKRTLICVFFLGCVSLSCGISFPFFPLKYFKNRAVDIIDKAGPKDECSRHLKAWIGDLFNFKKIWALQMLDASAKLQTGLLTGNIIHYGNYDQCLKISENKGNDGVIEGQYCTVAMLPVKNSSSDIAQILDFVTFIPEVLGVSEENELKNIFKLYSTAFGVCLPKSCSAENLQKLWDYIEYTFKLPVHISINKQFCSHKDKVPQAFYFDKYVIWSFGLIICLMCLSTIYDVMVYQKFKGIVNEFWEKLFVSFSVHKNLKGIFHYPTENKDNALSCLNGLKVLSMLWIICGHRFIVGFMTGNINMLEFFEIRKTVVALVFLMAPFSVDTFLVISGLLLAYKYMEIRAMLPPNRSIPYHMFYLLRLLRLWPALLATIFAVTSILKYLNSGPVWDMLMYRVSFGCANNGWLSALFMSNMVDFSHQCLEPSWYLAVDTQLYCIAPLLLYFLYKYPVKTTISLISLCFLSCLYAYLVTVYTKVNWTLCTMDEKYHTMVYQVTFVRMPAYIFGLLTGSFLYKFQHIRLPKVLAAVIWTISIALLFGVGKVTHIMINKSYNEYTAGMYNALASPAWSLAICLFILLCATGRGGIINQVFSFKVYSIFVKFSYSTYLLHLSVILLTTGNKRVSTYSNSFTSFHGYLGDLPLIFVGSLIWCLAFESPFINIANILIKSRRNYSDNDRKRLDKAPWGNDTVENHIIKTKQVIRKKK